MHIYIKWTVLENKSICNSSSSSSSYDDNNNNNDYNNHTVYFRTCRLHRMKKQIESRPWLHYDEVDSELGNIPSTYDQYCQWLECLVAAWASDGGQAEVKPWTWSIFPCDSCSRWQASVACMDCRWVADPESLVRIFRTLEHLDLLRRVELYTARNQDRNYSGVLWVLNTPEIKCKNWHRIQWATTR